MATQKLLICDPVKATRPWSCGSAARILVDRIRRRLGSGLLFFLACLGIAAFLPRLGNAETLTNAAQVLALTVDRAAQHLPVRVSGIVTLAEPGWEGRFFLQDDSGGVFVELISTNHPEQGDVVAVSGVSSPGGYAPMITAPEWEKIGTGPLPAPRQVPIE